MMNVLLSEIIVEAFSTVFYYNKVFSKENLFRRIWLINWINIQFLGFPNLSTNSIFQSCLLYIINLLNQHIHKCLATIRCKVNTDGIPLRQEPECFL